MNETPTFEIPTEPVPEEVSGQTETIFDLDAETVETTRTVGLTSEGPSRAEHGGIIRSKTREVQSPQYLGQLE